jgi:adenosylhomocysteine nucleosidase
VAHSSSFFFVFLVTAALATAAPASAQTPAPAVRPVVVQGAMQIEVETLAGRLEHATIEKVGGWTFWRGTVDGYPVIVSKTQKGMSNAAAATLLAVERYHPIAIINQGTAGGHDAALHNYDIVLGTTSVNLGAFKSPSRPAGAGSSTLDWSPIDLTAADGSAASSATPRHLATFTGDAALLAAARSVTTRYTKGRIVEGVIGSSDVWNDEIDRITRLHAQYGTAAEEMETASAAQIAAQLGVPLLGIRVLSDNALNGNAYDPRTSEACEDYVYQVVKAYIATLKK